MRKAALLYNPASGRRRGRRLEDVRAAEAVFTAAGIEVSVAATRSAEDAREQTRTAIRGGCDTIFACGGDGTVNDVLQGVIGSEAALGVIPLGTANALAHDLGLPRSPTQAARAALEAKPCRIAAGRLTYCDFTARAAERYFTVTAGVGIDGHLFYGLNRVAKDRLGTASYYARAAHLWLTHRMRFFDIEFAGDGKPARREHVSQLLGVRIGNFGGILRELAPGACLLRNDLRLVLFKTDKRWSYLLYLLGCIAGQRWKVPGIELEFADRVACQGKGGGDLGGANAERVYVEADGELLGFLPAEISIVRDALTILVPLECPFLKPAGT
jgi:YegS/Rv2252/BmrU family lipid kinase